MTRRVALTRIYVGTLLPAHRSRIEVEVELFSGQYAPASQGGVIFLPPERDEPVEVAGVTFDRSTAVGFSNRVRELRRLLDRQRPNVVVAHGLVATLIAAAALRGRDAMLLAEIHGALAFESLLRHDARWDRWLRFLAIYLAETIAILASDRLLLVSDQIRQYYPAARLRPSAEIPRLVRPVPVDGPVPPAVQEIRSWVREERRAGRCVFVYSGGAQPWQCLDLTLPILRRISLQYPASVLLLTHEPESMHAAVQRTIGSVPNTHWRVDGVPQGWLLEVLGDCDVGMLVRENIAVNRVASPTKLFEYFYAGLAVVSTPGVPTAVRIVGETGAGCVLSVAEARVPEAAAQRILEGLSSMLDARRALAERRADFVWSAGRPAADQLLSRDAD